VAAADDRPATAQRKRLPCIPPRLPASSSRRTLPGASRRPISTATIPRFVDQPAVTPKRRRSGMHGRHDDMRQSRRQFRPQVIEEGRHVPREDAAVLLRRDLAGNGRRGRRIRCGHRMPFLLAQTLLLLLLLLLEFFLPLLKLEIRFCQRITFLGLRTSPHTGAPASVRKWTARRVRYGPINTGARRIVGLLRSPPPVIFSWWSSLSPARPEVQSYWLPPGSHYLDLSAEPRCPRAPQAMHERLDPALAIAGR
jgi:hypothetical protein